MIDKIYPIQVEIAGEFAMFADPTTGPDAVSYPVPPYSAVKGMLETIAFMQGAEIVPLSLGICRPIQFMSRGYNCRFGAARKPDQITKGSALQRRETILYDVVYQIKAEIRAIPNPKLSDRAKAWEAKGINHAHALQSIFQRRVKRGQRFRITCLGRSDFPATYVGEFRPENTPIDTINLKLESLLHHPFDKNQEGMQVLPRYDTNVNIKNGILIYA